MTDCSNIATCIVAYWPSLIEIAFSIISVASAIAALTPTPTDDNWVGKIYRIVDLFALNFGYAKDRPAKKGGRFVPQ